MVFLIDDLIDGIAIGDLLYVILTSIFDVGELATFASESIASIAAYVNDLLGIDGMNALMDIINNVPYGLDTVEFDLEADEEFMQIYEEIGSNTQRLKSYTFNDFFNNVKIIARQLADKGYNMATTEGKEFLKKIVETAKNKLDWKNIATIATGTFIGNKIYQAIYPEKKEFLDSGNQTGQEIDQS